MEDNIVMSRTSNHYTGFIGMDVSKDSIAIHDSRTGYCGEISNSPAALRGFLRSLADKSNSLAICEATGGHEQLLLESLDHAGIPAHRADARKVKAFIRSYGIRAKTDTIDAKALAQYGRERSATLPLWQSPDAAQSELKAMVARRKELVCTRTAEKNRLKAPATTQRVRESCKRMIDLINREIADLQNAIEKLVKTHDQLRERHAVLSSVTGIGSVLATSLIANMPELGHLSRRQAASLAGVAPHPRQSGKQQAYRRTSGGRPEVKEALFIAALVAVRRGPTFKSFYQRLIDNGKKPIVALTALMRKIITILNAKLRDLFMQEQMS